MQPDIWSETVCRKGATLVCKAWVHTGATAKLDAGSEVRRKGAFRSARNCSGVNGVHHGGCLAQKTWDARFI